MASLDLTRLMKNARVQLPGAIDTNLQLELFNVLGIFFSGSNIWKEEITFAVTTADAEGAAYSIEQESVSSIVRLMGIVDSNDIPVAGSMAETGEIILDHAPGNSDTYTATVSLTVDDPVKSDGYPEFPAWILGKYSDGILDGLLARMMAQPAKPYTNMKLAAYRLQLFSAAIAQAKSEAIRKNINNAQAWRFPQSFATRR